MTQFPPGLAVWKASSPRFSSQVPSDNPLDWDLWAGRLVELSEPAYLGALTVLMAPMRQVQERAEQIVWICGGKTVFFAPDLVNAGIDPNAVTVIIAPCFRDAIRSCEWLLQSQGFAMIVVDGITDAVDEAILGRLARWAEKGRQAVIFLTLKLPSSPSLGTQISLRLGVSSPVPGRIAVAVLRDRHHATVSSWQGTCHGPDSLY